MINSILAFSKKLRSVDVSKYKNNRSQFKEIIFSKQASKEYATIANNIANKVDNYIEEILSLGLLGGSGHPEYNDEEQCFSRRLTKKDRFCYNKDNKTNTLIIISCSQHYTDK